MEKGKKTIKHLIIDLDGGKNSRGVNMLIGQTW